MHLSPPEYVVHVLNGPRATGRYIGRSHGAVIAWLARGYVPPKVQELLLLKARQDNLDITADDLILGRNVNGRVAKS